MGYFLISEAETAVPAKSPASPKTHVPLPRLQERGVRGNSASLEKFWTQILRLLYKWLNRRSHRRSYTWEGFNALLRDFKVPGPRITEPKHHVAETQQWFTSFATP
jgi:hypothetical protein